MLTSSLIEGLEYFQQVKTTFTVADRNERLFGKGFPLSMPAAELSAPIFSCSISFFACKAFVCKTD